MKILIIIVQIKLIIISPLYVSYRYLTEITYYVKVLIITLYFKKWNEKKKDKKKDKIYVEIYKVKNYLTI